VEKKKYIFAVTILVNVETKLELREAIDEFSCECPYDLPSTENVQVVNTEWVNIDLN
jgi:hypothetical protein